MGRQENRVLIYATCYNIIDGVNLTVRKIEEELLKSNDHVCILANKSGDPSNTNILDFNSKQEINHPNRQVIFLDNDLLLPFSADPKNPETLYYLGLNLSDAIKRQLDDFQPTIVHIATPDFAAFYVAEYARNRQLPLLGTYHSNYVACLDHYKHMGWAKPVVAQLTRHLYNFLQALYVPTPFVHADLVENYKMDKITNLRIWGRGVDVDTFSPKYRSLDFRHKLGLSDDQIVICFVGRLVPEKRLDIFSNVIQRLNDDAATAQAAGKNHPKFHALVVGLGPFEEVLSSIPNVSCVGFLNGQELATAFASSDIFLFPSGVETFGNVTLEAMASGLPLVVESVCSGHLAKNGINGFLCSDGDEVAFYEATRALIMDPNKRKLFGEQSLKLCHEHFEKRKITQQMVMNYTNVTNEFYRDYGGSHSNRDAAFVNEDSFWGGSLLIPLPLAIFNQGIALFLRILFSAISFVSGLSLRGRVFNSSLSTVFRQFLLYDHRIVRFVQGVSIDADLLPLTGNCMVDNTENDQDNVLKKNDSNHGNELKEEEEHYFYRKSSAKPAFGDGKVELCVSTAILWFSFFCMRVWSTAENFLRQYFSALGNEKKWRNEKKWGNEKK